MNKLLLIFTLLFTVLLSAPSYAKWTKVSEGVEGDTFYVDYERIRKVDGYVYWWDLMDNLKPLGGYLSTEFYRQGDCKLFRYKKLSMNLYKEPMGAGTSKPINIPHYQQWEYPSPESMPEIILKKVCNHAKTIKSSD